MDARGDHPTFTILRHESRGYAASRKQAGWTKSRVFDRMFRLASQSDAAGNPEYSLSVR